MENIVREKHPDLYFDDGDVVLQAKLSNPAPSKPQYQLCRVHKATLSHKSPVFSNLFADASASTGQQYDGVPLLEMSDAAGDLAQYLSYIYNPSHYLLRSSHPDTAFELTGAATLAGKYLLDDARADMVKRVVMDWPTNFDDWVISESQLDVLKHAADRGSLDYIVERAPEPLSAIVFAQTHGCTEILPAAFYRLASIDIDEDYDDGRWNDGMGLCARWSLCDRDNVFRWGRGRKALEDYHRDMLSPLKYGQMLEPPRSCIPSWLHEPYDLSKPPMTHEEGEEEIKKYPCILFLRSLYDIAGGATPTYDPLAALARMEQHVRDAERLKKTPPNGLCLECRCDYHGWFHDQRKQLWLRLPEIFGLQ